MRLEVEDHGIVIVIVDPTILCLATLESAILAIDNPKMKNSTTSSFLSVEDEHDENYSGEWKLNHSRFCRTVGSNVSFCFVGSFIGI